MFVDKKSDFNEKLTFKGAKNCLFVKSENQMTFITYLFPAFIIFGKN